MRGLQRCTVITRNEPFVLRTKRRRGERRCLDHHPMKEPIRTARGYIARCRPTIDLTHKRDLRWPVRLPRHKKPTTVFLNRPATSPSLRMRRVLNHRRIARLQQRDPSVDHTHASVRTQRCVRPRGGIEQRPRIDWTRRIEKARILRRLSRTAEQTKRHNERKRTGLHGVPRGSPSPSRSICGGIGVVIRRAGRIPIMSPTSTSFSSAKIGSRP